MWAQVERLLLRPDLIEREVAKLRTADPTEGPREAVARQLATTSKQIDTLSRRVATIEDDVVVAPLLAHLKELATTRRELEAERDRLDAQHAEWRELQGSLDRLTMSFHEQAEVLDRLDWQGRRDRMRALGVRVDVFKDGHTPRWVFGCRIPLADGGTQTLAVAEVTGRRRARAEATAEELSQPACRPSTRHPPGGRGR